MFKTSNIGSKCLSFYVSGFGHLNFDIVSYFDIRYSDFKDQLPYCSNFSKVTYIPAGVVMERSG